MTPRLARREERLPTPTRAAPTLQGPRVVRLRETTEEPEQPVTRGVSAETELHMAAAAPEPTLSLAE